MSVAQMVLDELSAKLNTFECILNQTQTLETSNSNSDVTG